MDTVQTALDWLSRQPNWLWLLLVALVTHRLTLRRERWNREQHRRTEQRNVVADFSAAVNDLGPVAAELATWLSRRESATEAERYDVAMKCDEAAQAFAEKVFGAHRAMDLVKMTLVDPELSYRAAFALKLCRDISELGGDRRTGPSTDTYSIPLLIHRCTTELKELMAATEAMVQEAVIRIPPQTTWWHRRLSNALARSKAQEINAFIDSVDGRSAAIFAESSEGRAGENSYSAPERSRHSGDSISNGPTPSANDDFFPIRRTAARSLRVGDKIVASVDAQAADSGGVQAEITALCDHEADRMISIAIDLADGRSVTTLLHPDEPVDRIVRANEGAQGGVVVVKGAELWKWIGANMNDPRGSGGQYLIREFKRISDPENGSEIIELRTQNGREILTMHLKLEATLGFPNER